ncbi:MAG: IclR family transcriptional regulator [Acidimicrobiales bacterium]
MNKLYIRAASTAPAVVTAIRVLDALAEFQGSATLDELTQAIGEPRSSVHRILNTLVESELLQRPGPRAGYRMGPKVMTWGSSFLRAVNLIDEFNSVASPIVARINETMQLAVLDWPDVVFIAHVDSKRPVRLVTEVGRRLPAHATAVGKAFLAFSGVPTAERYRHHEMRRLTPRTATTVVELERQLSKARRRGWAEASQESSENLTCLAAPVRGYDGRVLAAMTICVPEPSLKLSHRQVLGRELLAGCAVLARQIGAEDSYRPVAAAATL